MKNADFVAKVGTILKAKGIGAENTEAIKEEIASLLSQYKISPDKRKGPRPKNNLKSYRVRYKIYDEEKGYWSQHDSIRQGYKATDAKEEVMKEFPGCRVTSAWLI